jgi:hypothetical protein
MNRKKLSFECRLLFLKERKMQVSGQKTIQVNVSCFFFFLEVGRDLQATRDQRLAMQREED